METFNIEHRCVICKKIFKGGKRRIHLCDECIKKAIEDKNAEIDEEERQLQQRKS